MDNARSDGVGDTVAWPLGDTVCAWLQTEPALPGSPRLHRRLVAVAAAVGTLLVLVAVLSTGAAADSATVSVENNQTDAETTHVWTVDIGPTDSLLDIDQIRLDYGETGADLSGVTAEDITVNKNGDPLTLGTVTTRQSAVEVTFTNSLLLSEGSLDITIGSVVNPPNPGEYTVAVELSSNQSEDPAASASFAVADPTNFEVAYEDSGTTVNAVAGEEIVVNATIENVGDGFGTQTVELLVGGEARSSTSLTLDVGEVRQVSLRTQVGSADDGATVTVASADDTDNATLSVQSSATFEMTIDQIDDVLISGDELSVTYTVENTGSVAGTQDITLSLNGTTVATDADVQLAAGATTTKTFTHPVEPSDWPGLLIEVSSLNQTAQRAVEVFYPPIFKVAFEDDSPIEVAAGEQISLNMTVTNQGKVTDTQVAEALVAGQQRASTTVTLEPGASTTVALSLEAKAADDGEYLTAASDTDSASKTLSVESTQVDPPTFEVSIDQVAEQVVASETLSVDYTVENTGGVAGTQDIALSFNGTTVATDTGVEIAAGAKTTGTLTFAASSSGPALSVGVSSLNQTAQQVVEVLRPPTFNLTLFEDDSLLDVSAGDEVQLVVEVENVGDLAGQQTVEVLVNGQLRTSTSPELEPGAVTSRTLTFEAKAGDDGALVAVGTDTDAETTTLSVDGGTELPDQSLAFGDQPLRPDNTVLVENVVTDGVPSVVLVTYPDGANAVVAGITALQTATGEISLPILNTRGVPGEHTAHLVPADRLNTAYEPGDTLTAETQANVTASQTATISEESQSDPPVFEVTIDQIDQQVRAGETITLDYIVENTGTVASTQDVILLVGDQFVESNEGIQLGAGGQTTGTFTYATDGTDAPGIDIGVASANDSAGQFVSVTAPAELAVTIDEGESTLAAPAGEQLSVAATVENTGTVAASQTVVLSVDGQSRTEIPVEVAAGATTSVTLRFAAQAGDDGATATVTAGNDTATTTLSVTEPEPTGSVTVEPVTADRQQVPVSASFEATAGGTAVVVVTNERTGASADAVFEVPGSRGVDADALGGLSAGDTLTASLFETTEQVNALDTASATVGSDGEPALEVPPGVEFGSVDVGARATGRVALHNGGTAPLEISRVELDGNSAFSVDAGATPAVVSVGQSLEVPVTFTPEAAGEATATLIVESDDPSSPTAIPLSGVGNATDQSDENETDGNDTDDDRQNVTLSDGELAFGPVAVGETQTGEFTVENTGDVPVSRDNVTIAGPDAAAFETDVDSFSLAPGEEQTVEVRFTPTAVGQARASLLVERNGTTELAALSGVGAEQRISLQPETVEFGKIAPNESNSQSVEVAAGPLAVSLDTAEIVGDNADRFAVESVPGSLGANESATATVTYAPETVGTHAATLVVTSADGTLEQTVSLSGSADRETSVNTSVDTGQDERTVTATVENADAGEQVRIPLVDPSADEQYKTDNVSVTPAVDGNFTVDITSSSGSFDETPQTSAGAPNNTTRLGNISVDATLADDDIANVSFEARVDRAELEARGADPEDVGFFRFNETREAWNTTAADAEFELVGDEVLFRARSDGFSEWTAAAARPQFNITDNNVNVTASEVGSKEVEIQVFVSNTGGTEGRYVAELLLNETVVESKETRIAPGGIDAFNFEQTLDDPGEYEVRVNDKFISTVVINESGATIEDEPPANESGGDDDGQTGGPLQFAVPTIAIILLLLGGISFWYYRRTESPEGE